MKVCIFGNKGTTTALVKHLNEPGFKIDSLVTLNKDARSRVQISGEDETLSATVAEYGINVFHAEKYGLSTQKDQKFFADKQFDIGLCTGWQRLIPNSILRQFKHGVFGWHGSGFNFPNGRGRSPLNWSIRLGLDAIYHNCFRYSSGVDDGKIYETEKLLIGDDAYISDIQSKALQHIKQSAARLLTDAISGDIELADQIDHPFITFPALTEDAGFLSLNLLGGQEAINITRSCSRPFPGAFIKVLETEETIRIWRLSKSSTYSTDETTRLGKAICENGKLLLHFKDEVLVSDDFEFVNQGYDQKGKQDFTLQCA